MEARIYQWSKKRLERGRVEIHVQWEDLRQEDVALQFHPGALRFYRDLETTLRETHGIPGGLDISTLIRLKDVVSAAEEKPDTEETWDDLRPALQSAIQRMQEMQEQEGRTLRDDMVQRVDTLRRELSAIEETARDLPETYRERLEEKVTRLLDPERYDPQRFAQEIVLYVDKIDVTEEIVRLKSHLDVCMKSLEEGSLRGKRLDFLAQEILREVNTIGSKNTHPDIVYRVVTMKTELEKIREQAQNLL